MKSTDYIVIQAPMVTELHLKGNALLLFALITGFSKDQNSKFRGSLTYISEWLDTSRAAAVRALKTLEDAGLIKKFPTMVGKVQVNEYASRYNEVLEKLNISACNNDVTAVEGSIKMIPQAQVVTEVVSQGSTEMIPVSKRDQYQNDTKVVSKRQQGSTKMVPNNIDIIYNNINSSSYCELTPEEQEEEKKGLFEFFFWKNANNPAEEVERFIGHNTANGWTNRDGREYDSALKRKGLASLWKCQLGQERTSDLFLKFWREIYRQAAQNFLPGSSVLLDVTAKIQQSKEEVVLHCRRKTAEFIEKNLPVFKPVFQSLLQGRHLIYNFTN